MLESNMAGIVGSLAGDDLDDGLEYEVDFNGKEVEGHELDGDVSYTEPNEQEIKSDSRNSKKRKKNDSRLQEKKKMRMEIEVNKKKSIAKETSIDAIVDYLNSTVRHKHGDLSALELDEYYVKKTDVRTTCNFEESRTLDNVPAFINQRFKNMLLSKSKGNVKTSELSSSSEERKFIAIISMSAIRACDVHRATREVKGLLIKLINKNKIQQDLKILASTKSRVLCCTPGRLLKILNKATDEIKPEEIKILMLDCTYLDQKCQNVLDINETCDLFKSLVRENGSKIYLY